MRDRDERTFILVHDGIEDHPKIAALSDRAFRVLVGTWGWCSRNQVDGFIREAVWRKRAPKKVRDELEAELVHRPGHTCRKCPPVPESHVLMHDYLDWQRSAAQIEQRKAERSQGGKWGGHLRWHAGKRITDPDCGYCNGTLQPPSTSSTAPSTDDTTDRSTHSTTDNSPNGSDMGPGCSEVRGQRSYLVETLGGGVPDSNGRATPRPPERCPKHQTAPTSEPCGKCGDARRAAAAWDDADAARREHIARDIEAARADPRQRCEHGADGGLFVHPVTGQSATCAHCRQATNREAS